MLQFQLLIYIITYTKSTEQLFAAFKYLKL